MGNSCLQQDTYVGLVQYLIKISVKALLRRKGLGALLALSGVRVEGAMISARYGTAASEHVDRYTNVGL